MNISEIFIRRKVFAWMLMAGLIIFGGISFMRMGISELPDVDYPVVSVNIRLEGASPEVIETSITDIVENAVMSIQSIRSVSSESENSEGTVTIEFELNRDIDLAVQDVQAKVSSVLQKLPKDISSPTIRKSNPEDQPIILLTLESDTFPLKDLMTYTNDRILNQFSTVAGVGDITLGGYRDPNLRIWVNEKDLNRYELSVNDVINTIQNEHLEAPAGQMVEGKRQLNVRTMGEAKTIDEFGNLIINQRGGQPNYTVTHLKQVARVEEDMADALRYSRAMQTPCVTLNILKQRGSNAVAVAKAVRAKVKVIQQGLPEGMTLSVNFDSTRYIEQAVHDLNLTLILAVILTGLVCWMFLGSWSSTLNVLLAIPTSVIGTFIVLSFAGFTLNTFTLLGLSLSIGIVVDDAIMVMENIMRHQEKGQSKILAALSGSKEITFAAMAATISVVAIFLPVAFMSGVIGKFFFQFGVTITVAVLLSLVEALTLTPMRCSQFVKIGKRTTRIGKGVEWVMDKVRVIYGQLLEKALNHRGKVIFSALGLFCLSFIALNFLNKEFIPSEDQSIFNVRLSTPVGSALSYSDMKFKEVEKFLAQRSEVDRYVVQVGGGSPGDSNKGSVLVTMKDRGKRGIDKSAGHELSQQEFMAVCRKTFNNIPDVHSSLQDLSTKAFTASRGFPVEFTIQGPDWDKLADYSKQITDEMDKTGLVTDLDTNYSLGQPELQVIPDRKKASEHGVSIGSIAEVIQSMIGGVQVGTYEKNGHRYDIRLKLEESQESPRSKVKSLFVRNNRGELVPLSDLVTMQEKESMISIWRSNRERSITIYANVKTGESQQKALEAAQAIAKRILPPAYHIALTGSSQTFTESLQSLIIVLILGIIVAYMVLASQFNSFIDPLSVLMALPFSISGALIALFIAQRSLNIYSIIGMILLMGIVKKNSILLVDFTNKVRERGEQSVRKALLIACPIRLRPILMTSVATIAGAIPAALSIGSGADRRTPMAIAVIGGVIFSTVLTLFVVPCFYSVMSRFEGKIVHKDLLAEVPANMQKKNIHKRK
jgi:hydrophobe/amphiphile efflux-1 (HAE1) family protein